MLFRSTFSHSRLGCKAGVALLLSAGCAYSPVAPTDLVIPTELRAAWDLVGRETPEAVRHVLVAPLIGIDGEWRRATGTLVIATSTLDSGPAFVAGVLAHEMRHADGIPHDCAGERDRRRDGAWTAHAATLDRLGLHFTADLIRDKWMCADPKIGG